MIPQEIASLCEEKQNQLLHKYFGNLVHEAAIERPETTGEYTKDLPLKIEAEYRTFLEELSEGLRSFLPKNCIALRYDLNRQSHWCKENDYDDIVTQRDAHLRPAVEGYADIQGS